MSLRIVILLTSIVLISSAAQAQQRPRQLVPSEHRPSSIRQDKAEAKCETPEEVYAAYWKSVQAGDYTAFLTRVTAQKEQLVMFELCFGLGMQKENTLDRYLDNALGLEAVRKAGGRLSNEQSQAVTVASIKDKRAFFRHATSVLATQLKKETAEPPRKVTINGDRAVGVVTHYVEMFRIENKTPILESRSPYDVRVYFSRSEHTWLVDVATREEAARDDTEKNRERAGGYVPIGRSVPMSPQKTEN